MSWPPEQRRAEEVSWTLQIQRQPGGWWSNHTNGLQREDADALKAERQAAYPKIRYRLVRVTTTSTVEKPNTAPNAPKRPATVPVPADAFTALVRVAMWVSRGRRAAFTPAPDPFLGPAYPDASARRALGALDEAGLLQQFRTPATEATEYPKEPST